MDRPPDAPTDASVDRLGSRSARVSRCLVVAALLVTTAAQASLPSLEGKRLEEALGLLREAGLPLIYNSRVVRPDMRVVSEPAARSLREALAEILAPHELIPRQGPGGAIVIAPARGAGRQSETVDTPVRHPEAFDEITVRPSQLAVRNEETLAPTVGLDREETLRLPRLSEDLFRGLTVLPGVAGLETSARSGLRGGRPDETLILFDGLELIEPFHLKDLGSTLGLVPPEAVGRLDLMNGSFPVRYGDRMSGVLKLTPVVSDARRFQVAVSTLDARGVYRDRIGAWSWLTSGRIGASDPVETLPEREESPDYWDFVGRLRRELSSGGVVRFNLLLADDVLTFQNQREGLLRDYKTRYRNHYAWLSHVRTLGPALIETVAALGDLTADRSAVEDLAARELNLSDARETDLRSLRQDVDLWRPKYDLRFGWHYRQLVTRTSYSNEFELESPLAGIRTVPSGLLQFQDRLERDETSAYLSSRYRWGDRLTVEVGLRWDDYSHTGDQLWSPRLSASWTLTSSQVLRASVGRYGQAERPHELQVFDGETEFSRAERSTHYVLGYERELPARASLRVELYSKRIENPRPRFENLFEPVSPFPEFQNDRVKIEPEVGRAIGLELLLRQRAAPGFDWWVAYARSDSEDRIAGDWIPRSNDQRSVFSIGAGYERGAWSLALVGQYRSGRPTTRITLRPESSEDETEGIATLGPLFADRLSAYHRLDLRFARRWALRRSSLEAFVNLQNVYDRANVRGLEFAFEVTEDGETVSFDRRALEWVGFHPTAGLRWSN